MIVFRLFGFLLLYLLTANQGRAMSPPILLAFGPSLNIQLLATPNSVGSPGSIRFRVSGNDGPVTWRVMATDLPGEWASTFVIEDDEGVLLAPEVLVGGTFSITVGVSDKARSRVKKTFVVNVAAGIYEGWDPSTLGAGVSLDLDGFRATGSTNGDAGALARHATTHFSGKYAIRFLVRRISPDFGPIVGIRTSSTYGSFLGQQATDYAIWLDAFSQAETTYSNNSAQGYGNLANFSTAQEVMIELDMTAGKIWFGVNGSFVVGDPAAGTSPSYSGISGNAELLTDIAFSGAIQLLQPEEFITPASVGFEPGWPSAL